MIFYRWIRNLINTILYGFKPSYVIYCNISLKTVININSEFLCYKHPPSVSTENCCSLPNFYTENIKNKCNSSEDHFKLTTEKEHHCFISCAFEEICIFQDGKFQDEILSFYLNEALLDTPDIIDNMKNDFKTCVKNYEILAKTITTQGPCALYHVLVMDCVFIKTIKKCPDGIWSNTSDCNSIREYWRECLPEEL